LRKPDVTVSLLESLGSSTIGSDEFTIGGAEQNPPILTRGMTEGRRRSFRVLQATMGILPQDGFSPK